MKRRTLKAGDRVKYSRAFLRNTGQLTGPIPFANGIIQDIEKWDGCTLAVVDFGGELGTKRVNTSNLVHVDDLHKEGA